MRRQEAELAHGAGAAQAGEETKQMLPRAALAVVPLAGAAVLEVVL